MILGTGTLIVNHETLCRMVQEYLDRKTYGDCAMTVRSVTIGGGEVHITLAEKEGAR